jgi:hypothetical protein
MADEQEVFEIRRAVRRRVPQIMAIYGPTFSGKTFGALLLAAGLVEPGERIGFIDTENGRGSMYADDPDIQRLYPDSYELIELHPPFHPRRYIAANRQLVEAGCSLIITDSGSHAWEGEGGCQDIKEKDKAWNNAKLWNKRFSAALRYSPAHQIVCLRAQEKTKIVGQGRDQKYIPLGIMPICEKSFPFDLGLVFEVEGEVEGRPATHLAMPKKWPKAMNGLFNDWQPQLLTPEVGRKIREWNNSAGQETHADTLRKQARAASYEGLTAYSAFYNALKPADKKIIFDTDHAANKANAQAIDEEATREPEGERASVDPDSDAKFFGTAEKVAS